MFREILLLAMVIIILIRWLPTLFFANRKMVASPNSVKYKSWKMLILINGD